MQQTPKLPGLASEARLHMHMHMFYTTALFAVYGSSLAYELQVASSTPDVSLVLHQQIVTLGVVDPFQRDQCSNHDMHSCDSMPRGERAARACFGRCRAS